MNTLYIFGNGFDIAQGLKTRYIDFCNFFSLNFPQQYEDFCNIYGIKIPGYIEKIPDKEDEILNNIYWGNFEENLGNVDTESISEVFNMVLTDLESIDDGESLAYEELKRRFSSLCNLSEIFSEWISSINTSVEKENKLNFTFSESDIILSFNYTDTIEKNYETNNCEILHIHGLNNYGNDLIFGHEMDCAYEEQLLKKCDCEMSISPFSIAYDMVKSTIKPVNEILKNNISFFEQLIDIEKIVVFGLSLGKVDIPYIKQIIDFVEPNVRWEICYYNKKEIDYFMKLVSNLNIENFNFMDSMNYKK